MTGRSSSRGTLPLGVWLAASAIVAVDAVIPRDAIAAEDGGPLRILTEALPDATVGVPYRAGIAGEGGSPPYAFQVIRGRPSWLFLASDGSLEGTPDIPGVHELVISVFDSAFSDATKILSLEVREAGPLTLATSLPDAVLGKAYGASIATGGRPPYASKVRQGALPPGLGVDRAGRLAGTPTRVGAWTFDLEITDAAVPPAAVNGTMTIETIEEAPLRVALKGDIVIFTNVETAFRLDAEGGVPPYAWTLISGVLPSGLRLDPAGRLIGRVARVGTTTVALGVSDAEGSYADAMVRLRVQAYRAQSGRARDGDRGGGCSCFELPVNGRTRALFLSLATPLFLGLGARKRRRCSRFGSRSGALRLEIPSLSPTLFDKEGKWSKTFVPAARRSSARSAQRRDPGRSSRT